MKFEFFVSKILVALLQFNHKKTGHYSSGLLFNFWLLLVAFAIPELRWQIIESESSATRDNSTLYFVYFSLISVMIFLNCFADKEPINTTYPKTENPSPEYRASYLNQIFYYWFDRFDELTIDFQLKEKFLFLFKHCLERLASTAYRKGHLRPESIEQFS